MANAPRMIYASIATAASLAYAYATIDGMFARGDRTDLHRHIASGLVVLGIFLLMAAATWVIEELVLAPARTQAARNTDVRQTGRPDGGA